MFFHRFLMALRDPGIRQISDTDCFVRPRLNQYNHAIWSWKVLQVIAPLWRQSRVTCRANIVCISGKAEKVALVNQEHPPRVMVAETFMSVTQQPSERIAELKVRGCSDDVQNSLFWRYFDLSIDLKLVVELPTHHPNENLTISWRNGGTWPDNGIVWWWEKTL